MKEKTIMTQIKMPSNIAFKLNNDQPVELTPTFEGTGSGSAYLLKNKIVVTLAAAQHTKYVNIPTPINFKVRDVRIRHDNDVASSVQIANTTDVITDAIAIAGVDTDIDRPVEIDNDYSSFNRGDNDLRLIIATGLFTGVVEIMIEPTIS